MGIDLYIKTTYQPPRLPPPPPDEPPRLPPPIEPPLLPPELIVPPLDLDGVLLLVVDVGVEDLVLLLMPELVVPLELIILELLPPIVAPLLLSVFLVDILVLVARLLLFCSTVLLKFEFAGIAFEVLRPTVELFLTAAEFLF